MPESGNGIFKLTKTKVAVITAVLSFAIAFSVKDYIWNKFHWNVLEHAFPNFEVLEVDRTVDLTKWTPTPAGNKDDLSGKAVYTDWYSVRKIRDEGKEFDIIGISSGSDPKFTSETHAISQKELKLDFDWWGIFKNQDIAILDVSKEATGKPFRVNIQSVRYQGFSDTIENWCSIGIFYPTRKMVFQLNFPKNKIGKGFRFSESFFYNRSDFRVIDRNTAQYNVDSNTVIWTVDNPIVGNAYRIDWDW